MKKKSNQTLSNENKLEDKTTFFYYAFRNILLVGLPLLVVSAFVLSLPHSSATESASTSDQVYITLSTSCTISSELVSPHTIDINGGQHRENIGTTKIGTFCNDNNGYSIYAIGYSNNTDGNTDLVSNISDNYNIHTGIYDSNNPSSSSWGMKLTAGVGTGINPDTGASIATTPPTIRNNYNNYNVVPNVYTLVTSRASGTNMNEDINLDITGSYFTTTYDIYASSIQPSGTYVGKVKYIMTHPSLNTTNTITDIEAAFAMAGKQKIYYDENNNGPYFAMQDMTHDICTSVTRNGEITTTQLVDVRDKKSYYVTKLADNNCWMTQNLDLDLSHSTALTSLDTDLNDNSLTGAYSLHYSYDPNTKIITWTPENTTRNYSTGTGTAWSDNQNKAYSLDPGEWYWDGNDNSPNCNYLVTICEDFSQTPYLGNNTHGAVGNHYNWPAAIASDNSSSLTTITYNDTTNNPQNSICPKGWRLPTISSQSNAIIGSTNEFSRLNVLYNEGKTNTDASWTIKPLYFVRNGSLQGSLTYSGQVGFYWSSTIGSSERAKFLQFSNTIVNPDSLTTLYGDGGKAQGRSLRCLAR